MQIPAGEFKAKCLKLMEQVARTGKPIVITKRGVPVAKLMPPDDPAPRRQLFGYMAGTAEIRGDIINMPEIEWAVLSGEEDHLYADLAAPQANRRTVKPAKSRRRK